jgi:hypothetical protein
MPGQLSSATACGPVVGPLLQLDFRLVRKVYARVDVGLPLTWMQVKGNEGTNDWKLGWQVRASAGVGYYF